MGVSSHSTRRVGKGASEERIALAYLSPPALCTLPRAMQMTIITITLCITSAGNAPGVHAEKDPGGTGRMLLVHNALGLPNGTQILQVFHAVASAQNSEFQPRCPLSPQISSEALITIFILRAVQTGALFSFSNI